MSLRIALSNRTFRRTALRTTLLTAKNVINLGRGKMGLAEAHRRTIETVYAATQEELTVRQAAERYLRTHHGEAGINWTALTKLTNHFAIPSSQKQVLIESIIAGGYEAAQEVSCNAKRIAAPKLKWLTPSWQIEIIKDLFAGTITTKEWGIISKTIKIGQGEALFADWVAGTQDREEKLIFVDELRQLDEFMGIEEYDRRAQATSDIALGKVKPPGISEIAAPEVIEVSHFSPPVKTDDIAAIKQAFLTALDRLDEIAIASPVGGLAQRFGFFDEAGHPLPQATYPIQPLSRDSVFKLYADEILAVVNLRHLTRSGTPSPIAVPYFMMSSQVTDANIRAHFAANGFFGLGESNVFSEIQISVPVVSEDGRWLRKGRYKLNSSPHGHGDIWKIYFESPAAETLRDRGKKFFLVPQGNNPSVFGHAFTFAGLGIDGNSAFGLATSPRIAGAPEGSIVAMQMEGGQWSIRNVEYAIMEAFGLSDEASAATGYSEYPGNLNFLFADISAIRAQIEREPFPGELINFGKPQDSHADGKKVSGGRAEAQMQGVAEALTASALEDVPVFVMNAPRGADLSGHFDCFKNGPQANSDTVATCRANYSAKMAARLAHVGVVSAEGALIELTPAFANRQDVLAGKVKDGSISERSTVLISGFHTSINKINIDGDLQIVVENEVGDMQAAQAANSALTPDPARAGKVRIAGLTVANSGREKVLDERDLWQGEFIEHEQCKITVLGNGELQVVPGTVIKGDFELTVADGEKVTLSPKTGGGVKIQREKISTPSWQYQVTINEDPTTLDVFELEIV
ncbi:MAG: UTP--glucose-1-phosphate uridylyltransferase [Candidatus Saganbacteria bacterium]|nr:UTP--glucose-1-phosphate uridylyltransferase [Candidatus Saganbacteria bacterium]